MQVSFVSCIIFTIIILYYTSRLTHRIGQVVAKTATTFIKIKSATVILLIFAKIGTYDLSHEKLGWKGAYLSVDYEARLRCRSKSMNHWKFSLMRCNSWKLIDFTLSNSWLSVKDLLILWLKKHWFRYLLPFSWRASLKTEKVEVLWCQRLEPLT